MGALSGIRSHDRRTRGDAGESAWHSSPAGRAGVAPDVLTRAGGTAPVFHHQIGTTEENSHGDVLMGTLIAESLRRNRLLAGWSIAHFVLFLLLIPAAFLDPTQILGVSRWIKPMKFA